MSKNVSVVRYWNSGACAGNMTQYNGGLLTTRDLALRINAELDTAVNQVNTPRFRSEHRTYAG